MSDERSANAIDRILGQRLRARRLEIGMSQEKLALILGVTFQQVQKYEKGVNRIAASRLFDITAALEMSIATFFEGLESGMDGGASSAGDAVEAALATPEGMQLMTLFASIKNERVRRRLLHLVMALVEDANEK